MAEGRIYRDDIDRRRFLGLVSELPGRFSVEIHAFVLMNNRNPLLLRCREANLSEAIRWLQVSYAGRFNRAHRRRGHLFQGRFKSALLLEESALDEVARYIHLNPVRSGGPGLSMQDQRRAQVTYTGSPNLQGHPKSTGALCRSGGTDVRYVRATESIANRTDLPAKPGD